MSFFEEKIIFPSTPVPGINNDQSLTSSGKLFYDCWYIMQQFQLTSLTCPLKTGIHASIEYEET